MYCRIIFLTMLTLLLVGSAQAEDPCAGEKQRALVLSGGGPKGAFETGAIYHLVAHRKCDFHEFSGVSVGALNAAFLAQAPIERDATLSHANLVKQTENLVDLWQSIKRARDVAKGRRLATLRFGLFGIENLKDFRPLRNLIWEKISTNDLEKGRPVRVGVISFWDGGYREYSPSPSTDFRDYLYASAAPPVYAKLQRLPASTRSGDPNLVTQFADGGLRHDTPVLSYFRVCKMPPLDAGQSPVSASDGSGREACEPINPLFGAKHERVQQLFVIASNPYSQASDLLPVTDPKCCRAGPGLITDGRKILGRTLSLMGDASYRWDLDFMVFANEILRWRWQAYSDLMRRTPPERMAEAKRQFKGALAFPVESYNREDPDAPSLPYEIGLVVPEKQYAEVSNLLVFSPQRTREQLYCGCRAADKMMQQDFGLSSLAEKCADRFPPLGGTGKGSAKASPTKWDPTVCQQSDRAMRDLPIQTRTAAN